MDTAKVYVKMFAAALLAVCATGVLSMLVLFAMTGRVRAADAPQDACQQGGRIVYSLANLRDEGYSLESVEKAMRDPDMATSLAPWTADAVVAMARIVYGSDAAKKDLALSFYRKCMTQRVSI